MTFTKAVREYFGYKEGEKLTEFAQEIRALTDQDKLDLAQGLAEEFQQTIEVSQADGVTTVVAPMHI